MGVPGGLGLSHVLHGLEALLRRLGGLSWLGFGVRSRAWRLFPRVGTSSLGLDGQGRTRWAQWRGGRASAWQTVPPSCRSDPKIQCQNLVAARQGTAIMMHTAKQVAELLQVGVDVVKSFVDSGELDAIDVSLRRGKKRRLRIPEDAPSRDSRSNRKAKSSRLGSASSSKKRARHCSSKRPESKV